MIILNPIICPKCNNELHPRKLGVDIIDGKLMRICGFCEYSEEVE